MERHVSCSGLLLYTDQKLKGRNSIPWMSGAILNLMKKKESIRQKLKLFSSSHLREKLKNLHKTVKRMLRNSRDELLGSLEFDLNANRKRFWLVYIEAELQIAYNSFSSLDANISQCIR